MLLSFESHLLNSFSNKGICYMVLTTQHVFIILLENMIEYYYMKC